MKEGGKIIVQDYGTNCKDCERYQKLGDICMIEHGKKFVWEYCRDFAPTVVLPDYKELMRSVRADHALERKKEKEKKEKEKRRRLKEKAEREVLRKKKRRSMLRRRRERLKKKILKEQLKVEKANTQIALSKKVTVITPRKKKSGGGKAQSSGLENSENGIVSESDGVTRKGSDVPYDQ